MQPIASHPALVEIRRLFDTRGAARYGEDLSQNAHALQCGSLAERDGASPGLVLAAWLHDIGHLQHPDADAALADGADDAHEALGARFLSRWFGPEVAEPVRLHVQAKRYLCRREADYLAQLSPLSRRTLELQGGPMSEAEARAFERSPFHADAIRLRRWDDTGKEPGRATASQAHFLALAARCVRPA